MRRLIVAGTCALVFAVPAASQADRAPQPARGDDGCLVVSGGNGTVAILAHGGIFGRFDDGQIVVDDLNPSDNQGPKVFGALNDVVPLSATKTRYRGQNVRFRFTGGGAFHVTVTATGIDLSAVGHGSAVLNPQGLLQTGGTYSTDGATLCTKNAKPFPESTTKVVLGGPSGG